MSAKSLQTSAKERTNFASTYTVLTDAWIEYVIEVIAMILQIDFAT